MTKTIDETKSTPYSRLGKSFKNLRKNKLKLSQRKFAEKIGATQKSIWFWESGRRMPMLNPIQIKKLLEEMRAAGLDPIEDFPELFPDQESKF